jgi:hypothetical protein
MNVVDNLNSVKVINKPCVYSSTMRLSTFCGLHSDTEQEVPAGTGNFGPNENVQPGFFFDT